MLVLGGCGGAEGAAGMGEGVVRFVCGTGANVSHGGLCIIEDAQEDGSCCMRILVAVAVTAVLGSRRDAG